MEYYNIKGIDSGAIDFTIYTVIYVVQLKYGEKAVPRVIVDSQSPQVTEDNKNNIIPVTCNLNRTQEIGRNYPYTQSLYHPNRESDYYGYPDEFHIATYGMQQRPYLTDQALERNGGNIPSYMLHLQCENLIFCFGKKYINWIDRFVGKPLDYDGHILIVGGAGSGKSSCLIIPTIKRTNASFVSIDVKGEQIPNYDMRSGRKPYKVINLTREEMPSSSYDPYCFLRQDDEDDLVQKARELAHAIIPMPSDVREKFWIESAQNILTAVILYQFKRGISFAGTMVYIQTTPITRMIKDINNSKNEIAKMHIIQHTDVLDSKLLVGIATELSNRTVVFATDIQIIEAFTPTEDTLSWGDLETHNIFLRIDEDKLDQWGSAITLMLTQLIRTLERRPDKANSKDKPVKPVLLLLDEFPRLGKLPMIQNAIATLRSKGVTICLVIQSLSQLDAVYGKDVRRIIVDNCQYKAILNVTDPDTQKYFSDMVGSIPVVNNGFAVNYNRYGNPTGYSDQVNESREPIMYPHEFATLTDSILMTPEGFCRVNKTPYYLNGVEEQ